MKTLLLLIFLSVVVVPASADEVTPAWPSDSSDDAAGSHGEVYGASEAPIIVGGLTFFTDEGSFRIAANAVGYVEDCREDFEGSNLPPRSSRVFDDPLSGQAPCAPPGCPYPSGLSCRYMRVQANTLGGAPDNPSPRGSDGLRASSAGFEGAVSDIVLPNFRPQDGLDVIFQNVRCGAVGGHTLSNLGIPVTIRVFSTANRFLGQMQFSADIRGTHFMGVVSEDFFIGRINVYSSLFPAHEGLDNLSIWLVPRRECDYREKIKRIDGCRTCPAPRPCGFLTQGDCSDPHEPCPKRLGRPDTIPCPNGPGLCRIKTVWCDCH